MGDAVNNKSNTSCNSLRPSLGRVAVCAGARVRTPDQPVCRRGAGAAAGQLSAARGLARRRGDQPRVAAGHHPHHPGLAAAAPPLLQYLQVSSYWSAVENTDFSYWRGVNWSCEN